GECQGDLGRRPNRGGRVSHAPMRGDGLAGPVRADLSGGDIADGDHEFESGRIGRGEFVPGFGAERTDVIIQPLQQIEGVRIDLALGMGAGGPGTEPAAADAIEDGFGQDGTGRIAGAEEKNIVTHAPIMRIVTAQATIADARLCLAYPAIHARDAPDERSAAPYS